MKLPAQSRPVRRPPNFPIVTETIDVDGQEEIVERIFSNTTDPNDPGYFALKYGENGCQIFSGSAMMLGSWF